jgi:hypothetical protein
LSSFDHDYYRSVAPLRAEPAVRKSPSNYTDQERVIPEGGCQKSATGSETGDQPHCRSCPQIESDDPCVSHNTRAHTQSVTLRVLQFSGIDSLRVAA